MADVDVASAAAPGSPSDVRRPDRLVPVERIHPNPEQPRRSFNEDALAELAASIREKGIIQPLIVRKSPRRDGDFEIVAGERRWRAAQMASLHDVPVIVRDFTNTEVLEVAIVENIQRADLNPVDEANAYRQLIDKFGHTQEHLATALGKSRSHIANLMRLLTLPEDVQVLLVSGDLSAGHARALVGRDDASILALEIVSKGLSVRSAEALTRRPKTERQAKPRRGDNARDADTKLLEDELTAHLGMKVRIDHREGSEGGTVTIHYQSLERLDQLLQHLSRD